MSNTLIKTGPTVAASGSKPLSVPPSIAPSEGATNAQVKAADHAASQVVSAGQDIQSLIDSSISDSIGAASLGHDTVAAGINASTLPQQSAIVANGTKIAASVNNTIRNSIIGTAPNIGAAGLSADYPNWERLLYRDLSPVDALRATNYLNSQTALSDADKATISAQIAMGVPAPDATGVNGPTELQGGMPTQSLAPNAIGVNGPAHLQPSPSPLIPPAGPVTTTGNAFVPVCHAYGPCGPCTTAAGPLGDLGPLPQVQFNELATRQPNDNEVLQCRLMHNATMLWVDATQSWDCGPGATTASCAPGTQVAAELPASPPPTSAVPEASCPVYPPGTMSIPDGYAIVPTGVCVSPPGGFGNVGGGGQVSSSGGGNVGGGYGGESNVITVPPISADFNVNLSPPPPPPGTPAPPTYPNVPYVNPYVGIDDPNAVCNTLGAQIYLGGGLSGVTGGIDTIYNWFLNGLSSKDDAGLTTEWKRFKAQLDAADQYIKSDSPSSACGGGLKYDLAAHVGNARHLETTTGMPLGYFEEGTTYAMQYLCPQYIPEQGDIDKLYIASAITLDAWTCYTRAHGNLPHTHQMVAYLDRTKPGVNDVLKLNYLGYMDDATTQSRLQELGIINTDDATAIIQNFQQIPSVGSLLQRMNLDTDDDEIAAVYDLDNGLAAAYTTEIKQYANAQGYSDDMMKSLWRQHWILPSLSEAGVMLNRLRPGVAPEGSQFTESDYRALLSFHGIAPAYYNQYIALTNKVMNRRDLQNAYNVDGIDDKGVVSGLQSIDYSETDSSALLLVFQANKLKYQQQQAAKYNVWTIKSVIKQYSLGTINTSDASDLLLGLLVPQQFVGTLLQSAKLEQSAVAISKCIAGVRHRFLLGEFNSDAAENMLVGYGVESDTATTLSQQWTCELNSRVREVAAGKIVAWYAKGVISIDQLSGRLGNLGYSDDDTNGYIAEAIADYQLKVTKQNIADAKKQAAATKAAQKEAQAAAKQLAAQQAKAEKLLGTTTKTDKVSKTIKLADGSTEVQSTEKSVEGNTF